MEKEKKIDHSRFANYPGGKGKLFQKLINLIPPHEVYIESHLGAGAVMRYKRSATRNIGIEINPEVIDLWKGSGFDFELIHGDTLEYFRDNKFTGNEFVYCDPPYLRGTRRKRDALYKYEYTVDQHIKLLEVIKTLPCMVMISGYYSELYAESLKAWYTHSFQAKTHHHTAIEWLWMNYPPPVELHDYRYLGDNFREREILKRKKERWVARLKRMPVLERQALLSVIKTVNEAY